MGEKERVNVIVDKDLKNRAIFVLRAQGKNLTDAVKEVLEKYAAEFNKKEM